MKRCTACGATWESSAWRCEECGFEPDLANDIRCFAPALMVENEGYSSDYYEEVPAMEMRNFWFRARADLITWSLKKHFPEAASFLEIGCGTGSVLQKIAEADPGLALTGTEIFSDGLRYVRNVMQSVALFQVDARNLPFESEFDVAGAFDVIEHIEEDEEVLRELYRAVKPGGGIIITVPQHPFMWSQRDEVLMHKRRYTRAELCDKVRKPGFVIRLVTSFVTLPFPAMALSNFMNRKPRDDYHPFDDLHVSPLVNATLTALLAIEYGAIRSGVSLPFGGSLLMVAEKPRLE